MVSIKLFEAIKGFKVNPETYSVNDILVKFHKADREFPTTLETCLINDLFFEAIKWALRQDYILEIICGLDDCEINLFTGPHNQHEETFWADTEKEAFFEACQWLLDNRVEQ